MRTFLAGLALGILVLCASYALASRNSSGTMSGINGPYVSGTVISAATVNARLGDIETEITDSLDRSGKGGMLAALRGVDGTVAAPAVSFTSDTDTGLYRIGPDDLGLAVGGAKVTEWTATGQTVSKGLAADGGGFKHKRGTAGCTTGATAGSSCTTTVTWTSAFADANYTATCVCIGPGNSPIMSGITAKIAASVTFSIATIGGSTASCTTVDCMAVHD